MLSDRLLCELALLEQYKRGHKHLHSYTVIDDDPLEINFSLLVHNITYDFTAFFNRFFPYVPIQIIANTEFFSSHQYNNGAMCLKWGQDNWNKDIRFVDLIANLHELLYKENPLGKVHRKAESGDKFSFGQQLKRGETCSIILPFPLSEFDSKDGQMVCPIKNGYNDERATLIVSGINGKNIYGRNIPAHEYVYHISSKKIDDEKPDNIRIEFEIKEDENTIIFFSDGKALLFLANSETREGYRLTCLVKDYEIKKRTGLDESILNKRITIIGLGSVGSRVAVDLARAGFTNFYFVDDDVMLPYNVIRHELTYRNVGEYKVNALKALIQKEINEKATIEVSTLAMTGQESSTSTNRFVEKCSESDLIIDCTAYDPLLLMLSQMTEEKRIPVISGTVIPGGLGNIILIKKTNDTNLESILASYYKWLDGKTIFAQKVDDYSSSIDEQTFTAVMSDCSILSGLIGKFSIQVLQGKEDDLYNINVLSTSNYRSLSEFFNAYKVKANTLIKEEEKYDSDLIEAGIEIYENYCSEKHS